MIKHMSVILSLALLLILLFTACSPDTASPSPGAASPSPDVAAPSPDVSADVPDPTPEPIAGEALYNVYAAKVLNPPLAKPEEGYNLLGVKNVQIIAPLTGEYSINKTSTNYDVFGTDLGILFEKGDKIFIAFGDTFSGPSFQGNWRSNVLAYTTDHDPSDGILFDGMISLKTNKSAIEILRSKKRDKDEMTVIPTGGVVIGDDLYMCYMSVRQWGVPGEWDCNYGGMAKSTDDGQTWQKSVDLKWDGDGTFVQMCPIRHEGYIYFYGIGGGRSTSVGLMRVPEEQIEDRDAYQYVTGFANDGSAIYEMGEDAEARACAIIPRPAGELSVVYNPYVGEWLMTYLHNTDLIVRTSKTLEGPFSAPRMLAKQSDYPSLYGAFMTPSWMDDGGRVMYFIMSIYDPIYQSVILRAELIVE